MEITRIDMHDLDGQGRPKQITLTMPTLPEWTMAREIGYTPKTTFWQDFSIADLFGFDAIVDTFNRAFNEWHKDVEYIAEMSLVLNHKGCAYYVLSEHENEDENGPFARLAELYFELWGKLHEWAKHYYEGDDAQYYFNATD